MIGFEPQHVNHISDSVMWGMKYFTVIVAFPVIRFAHGGLLRPPPLGGRGFVNTLWANVMFALFVRPFCPLWHHNGYPAML